MKAKWVLAIDCLTKKEVKMYEEEAKALLEKYKEELKVAIENEEYRRRNHYSYAKAWVQSQELVYDLGQKIAFLEHKMKAEEEDEDE